MPDIQSVSVWVTHKCSPAWVLGPAAEPMWITHKEATCTIVRAGKSVVISFYILIYKCHFVISIARGIG